MKLVTTLALSITMLVCTGGSIPVRADHAKNYCQCIFHYRQSGWLTDPGYNPARTAACTKNFSSTKPANGVCPGNTKPSKKKS